MSAKCAGQDKDNLAVTALKFFLLRTQRPALNGVGIFLSKRTTSAIIRWKPVRQRIITARMQTQQAKVSVIQVYAPTETVEDSVQR